MSCLAGGLPSFLVPFEGGCDSPPPPVLYLDKDRAKDVFLSQLARMFVGKCSLILHWQKYFWAILTYFVCDIQKHMMTHCVALWSVCVTVLMLGSCFWERIFSSALSTSEVFLFPCYHSCNDLVYNETKYLICFNWNNSLRPLLSAARTLIPSDGWCSKWLYNGSCLLLVVLFLL